MATAALSIVQADRADLSLELPPEQTFEQWVETGRNLATANKVLNWWIGDWWAAGDHRYGARAAAAAQGIFKHDFQSLANMAAVCRAFETSRRREHLTFTHHAEVASLAPAKADQLLDRAEREGWSTRDLRAEAMLVRDSYTPRWFDAKPATRYDRDTAKEAVFSKLDEAAELGAPCPTADDLAEAAGVESVSTTVALMHVLEREQRIAVDRFQKSRVVTIVATGKSTAPPANTTPHWRDLPGRVPAPAANAYQQRHPDKATLIFGQARKEGRSPQDYLDYLVELGWDVVRAMSDSSDGR